MASSYEFWLTDDAGTRILELKGYAFVSYSRSTLGFSTLQMGLPYKDFVKRIYPVFEVDRRIEVWRSPDTGHPLRREQIYFLRKPRIYTRDSDDFQIIELFGRSPVDLLGRRIIVQAAGSLFTSKTGTIDDIMKAFVREQMLYGEAADENGMQDNDRAYPQGEFFVQPDLSLGPSVSVSYSDRNVLEVLRELKDMSFQKNKESIANPRIYFDVVPASVSLFSIFVLMESGIIIEDEWGADVLDEESILSTTKYNGLSFQTFADLYGTDRTTGVVFSAENGNLEAPDYQKTHLEEVNAVIVKGFGRGDSRQTEIVTDGERIGASRWNRCEAFLDASSEPDQSNLADLGRAALWKGEPVEEVTAIFLSVPQSGNSPRSLYGLDWDLGDLLPVEYAGQSFDVEVAIVYVSLNENGEERITGRNQVDTSTE